MVLALLSCICFLGFSKTALAEEAKDADYAGSTKVKAYVIAASEDVPENDAKDEDQPPDGSETKVETGDQSQAVFWIMILLLSGTGLLCEVRRSLEKKEQSEQKGARPPLFISKTLLLLKQMQQIQDIKHLRLY